MAAPVRKHHRMPRVRTDGPSDAVLERSWAGTLRYRREQASAARFELWAAGRRLRWAQLSVKIGQLKIA